jgi:hypothetical protein
LNQLRLNKTIDFRVTTKPFSRPEMRGKLKFLPYPGRL